MWSLRDLFVSLLHTDSWSLFNLVLWSEQRLLVANLALQIKQPSFPELIRRFLYDQQYPDCPLTSTNVSLHACPPFSGMISVFASAAANFYAPSDPSGTCGMRREHIRANPSWRQGPARYDCAFVNSKPERDGIHGLSIVRILLFFSFVFDGKTYPCALVRWFSRIAEEPDEDTGMLMVQPEVEDNGSPSISVLHLDCIFRAAHLLPIYDDHPIDSISPNDSLDVFPVFYVNKYIDHHAFQIAS
jgi:hypothetical protein